MFSSNKLNLSDPLFDVAQELEEVALKDPYFVRAALFQCGLLLGCDLPSDGLPCADVHGFVCDWPTAWLDCTLG